MSVTFSISVGSSTRCSAFQPRGLSALGQYDKSAGNKTPTRAFSFFFFGIFPPSFVSIPLFFFFFNPRSLLPTLSLSLFLSRSPVTFFTVSFRLFLVSKRLSAHTYSRATLYGTKPVVQRRIINYRRQWLGCIRIFRPHLPRPSLCLFFPLRRKYRGE